MFHRRNLLIFMASVLCALPLLAESNVRIVRLSYIDGDAQVNTGTQDSEFTHAVLNMPVTAGMWLYTPKGGRAEVQFENGSTVRLVNDAQIQFQKLALADSGGKIDIINVDHGVIYLNFDKVKADDNITIVAGGKTLHVTKSSHLRIDADAKNTKIAMLKGEATLDAATPLDLKSNETLAFKADTSDELKTAKGVEKIDADSWDKNRDNELAILGSRSNGNSYAYPDAYAAQFASLGAYGNYYNVAGYGTFWQPFGMGAGWSPFMDGMWGYYPGFGYTWISSYPWGWGPYRYGQWNYLPAYGWVWAPGSNFNAWNVGPRFGAVPAGYRVPTVPVSPANGKRPTLLVVGHPPNVHPSILSGKAEVGARPNARPELSHTMVSTSTRTTTGAQTGPRPLTSPTMRPTSTGTMRTSPPKPAPGPRPH
jgi:hypothetical protein